jgi:hypothetical protein
MAKKKKKTAGSAGTRTKNPGGATPVMPKSWSSAIEAGDLPGLKRALEADTTDGASNIRQQLRRATRLDPVELLVGLVVLVVIVGFYVNSV